MSIENLIKKIDSLLTEWDKSIKPFAQECAHVSIFTLISRRVTDLASLFSTYKNSYLCLVGTVHTIKKQFSELGNLIRQFKVTDEATHRFADFLLQRLEDGRDIVKQTEVVIGVGYFSTNMRPRIERAFEEALQYEGSVSHLRQQIGVMPRARM